jgi:hypothetical protein
MLHRARARHDGAQRHEQKGKTCAERKLKLRRHARWEGGEGAREICEKGSVRRGGGQEQRWDDDDDDDHDNNEDGRKLTIPQNQS